MYRNSGNNMWYGTIDGVEKVHVGGGTLGNWAPNSIQNFGEVYSDSSDYFPGRRGDHCSFTDMRWLNSSGTWLTGTLYQWHNSSCGSNDVSTAGSTSWTIWDNRVD